MRDDKYKWIEPKELPATHVKELSTSLGLNPTLIKVLLNRGLDNEQSIKNFIEDDQEAIHDPFLLHDMQKAIDRIQSAIENGESILVYGDYDADGVTSTAVMYETLEQLGANIEYFVPDRFKDGYGPNMDEYQRFIDAGVQLIITVDNGVSGFNEIELANQNNVDVIITDHHELPDKLPNALAVVHPRYPQAEYPFYDLSGVGVAFKVAQALLEELPTDLLDLYAIGTIGDLVSLTDENRQLVKWGLKQLQETQRIGLAKLMEVAGLNQAKVDEQDIGFGIAPRLNAVGRIENATKSVELLLTFDEDEAGKLAEDIDGINKKRQGLVQDIYSEAEKIALDEDHKNRETLVVVGHNWHQGVLGIVASRLVELTNKPTLVLSDSEMSADFKGSGRSVPDLNLFNALNQAPNIFENFGGHHMAVGLTIAKNNLKSLEEVLEKGAKEADISYKNKAELKVDAEINASDISLDLIASLKKMGPFGTDNQQPFFELKHIELKNVKAIGQDSSHLKFALPNADGQQIDAIAFKRGELADQYANATDVSLVGTLSENEWRGNVKPQIMVKDLKTSGIAIIDQRTNNFNVNLFQNQYVYVFFHEKLLEVTQKNIPNRELVFYKDLEDNEDINTFAIVDCPESMEDLESVLGQVHPNSIVLYFFHQTDFYAAGMPTRQEFGHVFSFLKQNNNFEKAKLGTVSKTLNIPNEKFNFILNVFFELNFVKIDNGLLKIEPVTDKVELSSAPIYQRRKRLIKVQEQLLYSNSNELTQLITPYLGE
ncbi:single-stranded-DNA-specific exonuclease RecJ [Pediococcus argentinicus]|uniref:Single-stranded-DNA-specific exonuclease RecJ n=1 Tax=Pediococcus argentinicus TaxID=480391 RepID=A0A0R2NIL9_9LACO|nr:single-stranded-DNA-specific exonuclease RecJ [Pediococcus argentinicus]KRO25620.1 recJ protein [Pediococcus argentinicus]NKZ22147.1 single-stranded-DNA-specific exonuclease RecJ [Pediococcus argentinicus]GEP19559.1 single-stranded-DNA-specific exonuclease [Pediococcus argentinicus]